MDGVLGVARTKAKVRAPETIMATVVTAGAHGEEMAPMAAIMVTAVIMAAGVTGELQLLAQTSRRLCH